MAFLSALPGIIGLVSQGIGAISSAVKHHKEMKKAGHTTAHSMFSTVGHLVKSAVPIATNAMGKIRPNGNVQLKTAIPPPGRSAIPAPPAGKQIAPTPIKFPTVRK